MPACVLKTCKNRSTAKKKDSGVTYHRFPRPGHEKREAWIKFVQKNRNEETWLPSDHTLICSDHFKNEDKYITKTGRQYLIKCAEPYHVSYSKSGTTALVEPISEPSIPGPSTSGVTVKEETDDEDSKPGPSTFGVTVKEEPVDEHVDAAPSTSGVTVKEEQSDGYDPLASCPSPSGLSDIGSEELEGALDTPTIINLRQQIKDLQYQLKQKDNTIQQKDKTIKQRDKTIEQKDITIKHLEETVSRIQEKNQALKSVLTNIKKKLVAAKNVTNSGNDSDDAAMEVA